LSLVFCFIVVSTSPFAAEAKCTKL